MKEEDNSDFPRNESFKRVPSMFDESVVVLGADDVQSPPSSASAAGRPGARNVTRESFSDHSSPDRNNQAKESPSPSKSKKAGQWPMDDRGLIRQLSDHSENSEDDDEDDNDVRAPMVQGGYDPNEFEELAVSEEIKDVFSYITKYTPQNVELENKLCPFLLDFIPAVGDIDAFIKVPRPDGAKDTLGLSVLDEPCTVQSDPAVLQLQLRAVAKQSSAKAMVVKKIENAEKNGKAIERWIKAISDLHRSKPPSTIHYSKPMPNMDNLMQEWPPELEAKLDTIAIPNPDMDCPLSTYVTIICNLFDIPVYESKIQSLHAFFTLYSTMKSTQGQLIQPDNNE